GRQGLGAGDGDFGASLHHGRAAPYQILPQDLREDPQEEGRAVLDRRADRRLVRQDRPEGALMHPRERLAYSPIEGRPPLKFPKGVRLVIWPVLALEEWDMSRPMARMVISPPQGQPQQPDHPNWSWHEYGMRVGFWRLRKLFNELGVSPTCTLNARVCETYPSVVKTCI